MDESIDKTIPSSYSLVTKLLPSLRWHYRPQRVPDKLIKYTEKTEMRETPKKPDLTDNL